MPYIYLIIRHITKQKRNKNNTSLPLNLRRTKLMVLYVDREGREHPVLYGLLGEHLGIAYVVAVAIPLVAIDDDAKHVEDGIAMAVEGAARHGEATTHLGLYPMLVDFLEGEALVAVYGVDEPNVFFEKGGGTHRAYF